MYIYQEGMFIYEQTCAIYWYAAINQLQNLLSYDNLT